MHDYQENVTTDRQTHGHTYRQTLNTVIPMCRYALHATQKLTTVYANYIGPLVMTDANKVGPVKDPLYVMIKLLKMTDVS